jgi:hypothetical protein
VPPTANSIAREISGRLRHGNYDQHTCLQVMSANRDRR